MNTITVRNRVARLPGAGCALALGWAVFATPTARTAPPEPVPPSPPALTLDAAVIWALQNNPEIAAVRQQHGIAEAGIVIARTYPFNPLLESRVQSASGPHSAAITNRTPQEQLLFFTVELFAQGRIRRQAASATLSRTDWEIAFQEQTLGVRVMRAFRGLLYRQEKLRLAGDVVRLNQEAAREVQAIVEKGGKLRQADLILARAEVDNARALLGPARGFLATARAEFLRSLGAVDEPFAPEGNLEIAIEPADPQTLTHIALENRADLWARRAAVDEAEARLRLEIANRFGNPVLGPAYTYDPTGVQLIGAQVNLLLPVFNKRRGEIMQRRAERERAILDVNRTEVQIRQEVQAALNRLAEAQKWTGEYKNEVLPNLRRSLEEIDKLFAQNDPGVDLLRVINVRRSLLRAQDIYLDALWELNQARTDLAAALGEPAVAAAPCGPPPPPAPPAPPPNP
jgi:cobalt-zinc-cadmium efflux system outer membrane protein